MWVSKSKKISGVPLPEKGKTERDVRLNTLSVSKSVIKKTERDNCCDKIIFDGVYPLVRSADAVRYPVTNKCGRGGRGGGHSYVTVQFFVTISYEGA